MGHIEKKKKKINSCSGLDQKEINSAETFHHCGGTASRKSLLGIKYLIIMKENQIIVSLCALWMWKLFTQKPGSTLPVVFFLLTAVYYFLMASSHTLAISKYSVKQDILSIWERSGKHKRLL